MMIPVTMFVLWGGGLLPTFPSSHSLPEYILNYIFIWQIRSLHNIRKYITNNSVTLQASICHLYHLLCFCGFQGPMESVFFPTIIHFIFYTKCFWFWGGGFTVKANFGITE